MGYVLWQLYRDRLEAALHGGLTLQPHVRLRVFPRSANNDRETRRGHIASSDVAVGGDVLNARLYLSAYLLRYSFTIDDLRGLAPRVRNSKRFARASPSLKRREGKGATIGVGGFFLFPVFLCVLCVSWIVSSFRVTDLRSDY